MLKEINREIGGIEHVEKLMGDTADAVAYQQVRGIVFRGLGYYLKERALMIF